MKFFERLIDCSGAAVRLGMLLALGVTLGLGCAPTAARSAAPTAATVPSTSESLLNPTASATAAPTSSSAAPGATPTAFGTPAPNKPPLGATATMVSTSTSASSASTRLTTLLSLADSEMHAAQVSTTMAETKRHAEAVVNILVGKFGGWYGDQDGDGAIADPSDGSGVLPGEKIPGPALDTPAQFPFGWALIVYSSNPASHPAIQTIIGDVDQWRSKPSVGYDTIEHAMANPDQIGKLNGTALRAVAYARLILTRAQSLEQAQGYAQSGAVATRASLEAARSIAP